MKFFVGDLVTGRNIIPIPASDGDFEIRRNREGTITAEITLSSAAHRKLDLYNNAAVGETFLALAEGSHIFASGAIWDHDYDLDAQRLSLTAEGWWSVLNRRFILPAAVETMSLLLTSGDDEGKPNPAVATVFTAETWPGIVRGIIEQGFARSGGELPIVFGPDGVGAHDKLYDAASFKPQGEAITDLTELVDGPEVEFRAFFNAAGDGIEVLAMVGDDDRLEIASVGLPHRFDFSAPKKTVRGLRVKSSAREQASEAWATGGRQSAVALISRAASTALTDAGYPRLESLTAAHSTVSEQATLDDYAAGDLAERSAPARWWSFETNMDKVPTVGSLKLGDYCNVVIRDDGYLPDGVHPRRIAAISGSLRSRWLRITTDEVA